MIYKFVGFKSILNKIYSDLALTTEVNEAHIIGWIGECLEKVGAYSQYEELNTILELKDGMVELPINFDALINISHNNRNMSWSTSSSVNNYYCPDCKIPTCCTDNNFYISGNSIITDIKSNDDNQNICITYMGTVVDQDGYPMIPDRIEYIELCVKYVTYMLDYREWRKGNIPDKVSQKSEQEYLWAIGAAKGAANMPNLQQTERLKNIWTRLIPQMNEYRTGFNNLGKQERRFRY